MHHLEFMIAESSTIKARALSITRMSLSALVRQRAIRLSIPTPGVHQSYVPTSSMTHPCPMTLHYRGAS